MIKKIYLIISIILLTSSCGKKSDPVYKGENLIMFEVKSLMIS